MALTILFFSGVKKELLDLPPKLQARLIRLFEVMEKQGSNLGEPHTKKLRSGLYEVRAKAAEGIARAVYCNSDIDQIIILHVFVKKTQKTSIKDLTLAIKRQKRL